MIIDVAKCENCNNCFLACKDEHVDNEWRGYAAPQPRHGQRWMNLERRERGLFPIIDVAYRPTPCMHCDNAPCIARAQNGAVYKRKDGIVLIDPAKAVGQKHLVEACPYHAIYWNEERNVPQKCTLCAHLLDQGWEKPRCAHSCPTGALHTLSLEDDELARLVAQEQLETLLPQHHTKPRIFYKNLYRFSSCFVAGSVAVEVNDRVECAAGAAVTLYQGEDKLDQIVTGNYGDFKFDRLPPNSGQYSILVEMEGREETRLTATVLNDSLNLGVVMLSSAAAIQSSAR
jgi:Fe-S-cluster-containing dehydrogenase component